MCSVVHTHMYTRVAYTWPRAHFFLIYMLEPFVLLHNKHMSNNACSISWQNCLLHPLPLVTLYNNTFEFVLYATPNPSETTTRMHKKYQMSIIAMYNNQQTQQTPNTNNKTIAKNLPSPQPHPSNKSLDKLEVEMCQLHVDQ
jgi:hypothetical protein